MAIARNVAERRRAMGLSLDVLGRRAGVSKGMLVAIEAARGKRCQTDLRTARVRQAIAATDSTVNVRPTPNTRKRKFSSSCDTP